ncbi:hypothetical protein RirG_161770 [Rhizophagus irregularis DAOM 197198w]|uniref:Uncharacterized protein n=1 Tax=Rhizophagus irregularis (strain DAOM 197198w) TaxID=1432141 RepID=A0A015M6H0_RHIIW|nr:hypothetical protein RirG_161770 [Rhizophagus irregularis DAOM 197198w]
MDNSTLKHIERAISITADIDDFIENIFDEDDTIVDGNDFTIASLSKIIC